MTWDNHRSGSKHVKSALDKGIMNGNWIHLFPKVIISSSQTTNSDHRPLFLDTSGHPTKFKRFFKFEEGWTRDDRSKLVVANAWDSKLPAGARDWKKECDIHRSLNETLTRKALHWKQRARISWLKEGDRCSKIFFLSAAIRGRRNAIERSDTGQNLDCGHLFPGRLSLEDQEGTLLCPSRDEIKSTLFAMSNHKAPGPDGMLSWRFIDHALECFGFPQKLRNWVTQCISTTTLNICLNGGQVGKIMPSCGLRQGDPLSSYLFICAAEILSRLLEKALGRRNIQGIKLSRGGLVLSHLFFVDDLILVGRANLNEAKWFWECLERFCSWSGQKVNKLKTSIFFNKNTPNGMRRGIKEALGIDCPEGVIKYMGLPLFRSRQKDADFNFILDHITSKLQGWKAKTSSKAGRATLIKSVGLAMPIYAMQTTKLSSRLVKRINVLVRDFWWGFEKGNHGLHLKAWDKLCLPKSLGGLGFRKTEEMNLAFLAKWGWNILKGSQSLCCKILEAKYLKGKDFLSCRYKDSNS
ncbi:hypothetical protein CsatB_025428 [Cannabis sativa]|uniref:uncharacterized protein LOC133031005 n=1 Tax=Cannabis sativa TaxID=3483 RepID=UPI0029CA9D2D|nr:uncharacterized protein LOC133031005 [Cannabis sativa]